MLSLRLDLLGAGLTTDPCDRAAYADFGLDASKFPTPRAYFFLRIHANAI